MSGVVPAVALPYTPPRPGTPGWDRIVHTLIAADGTRIALSDYQNGLELMRGVRGMGRPPFEHFWEEWAAHAGASWAGMLEKNRDDVFWPMAIYSDDTSEAWRANYRRFWAALNPRTEVLWEVASGPQVRTLRMRAKSNGDDEYQLDPYYFGWATFPVHFVGNPFWEGPAQRRIFNAASAPDFTGPDGGPPFFPGARNTAANASLTNPGDVDTSLVWRIEGPQPTGVSLGFAGYTIDVPFEIEVGETLIVDSRPLMQVAYMEADSADRTPDLGTSRDIGVGFPPGAEIPLDLDLSGTGSVICELTPLYWTAL